LSWEFLALTGSGGEKTGHMPAFMEAKDTPDSMTGKEYSHPFLYEMIMHSIRRNQKNAVTGKPKKFTA
jgi:hypothetical protein